MKMQGRRTSSNVDDRRGMSGGAAAGLGIGGILIAGLVMLLLNGGKLDMGSLGSILEQLPKTISLQQRKKLWQSSQSRFWHQQKTFGPRFSESKWALSMNLLRWFFSPLPFRPDAAAQQLL